MSRRTPVVTTMDGHRITAAKAHPAQYSDDHIRLFSQLLALASANWTPDRAGRFRVIDGMGGVAGIHKLDPTRYYTVAVDIEPAYVHVARQLWPDRCNLVGDATTLCASELLWQLFHAYLVSPTFANRLSDHHNNLDVHRPCEGQGCDGCWGAGVSLRRSYHHDAQRIAGKGYQLHPNNTGLLGRLNGPYTDLHAAAWRRAFELLVPLGLMAVDVKDSVRDRKPVEAVALHRAILADVGFEPVTEVELEAPGNRNGANRDARAKAHTVIVCRKPRCAA